MLIPVITKSIIKPVPQLINGVFEMKDDLVSIAMLPIESLSLKNEELKDLVERYPGGLITVEVKFCEYSQWRVDKHTKTEHVTKVLEKPTN